MDEVTAAAREDLDQLTKPMSEDDPRSPAERLSEQVDAVRAVAGTHQLDLELFELAGEDATLNCYRFALGLGTLPPNVQSLCFDYGGTGIGRDFVSFMTERYLVEATIADAADGDLAVYARGTEITHAGIVDTGRVRSKWGSGHVWRHGTFAVPASYGSSIRVFRACSSETALRGLIEYFREKPTFGPEVVDAILAKGSG